MFNIPNSVRLPHFDGSADSNTRKIMPPEIVSISMAQHIGAPCEPLVKVGDRVTVGQRIGDSEAFVSAPIHASVSGEVIEIKDVMNVGGRLCKTVVIRSDNRMERCPDIKQPVITCREDFIRAVRESGSVGLGGAGFPTHVKMSYDRDKVKMEYLLINAAECEPYITSDYREIIENSNAVMGGIKLIMQYLDIPRAIIGIEADKPEAIEKLKKLAAPIEGVSVRVLRSRYPQGAEKVLVKKLTGRTVREGKLPADVGCMVMNVSTCGFIHKYIRTGMPLVKRRVTIDGNIINSPANIYIPVGTPLHNVLTEIKPRKSPDKIIMGGPMMGACAFDPDTPLGKTSNAVLLFADAPVYEEGPCIRCGSCVRACPMSLVPTELESAYAARDAELLKKLRLNLCMNCGACSYSCPAKRNLAEKNQLAKDFLRGCDAKNK